MSIFNLNIATAISSCGDSNYAFWQSALKDTIEVGDSFDVVLYDGVGPYTWEVLSPGCTIANATTTSKTNTLTCNAYTGDGFVRWKVTDSCGTVLYGAVGVDDYWGDGCLSGSCASAGDIVITPTGDINDVQAGDTFTVTGGVAPYRWRVTGASTSGSTPMTIDAFYWLTSKNIDITITCIDFCGRFASITGHRHVSDPPVIDTSWSPVPGETVTYSYGCDDDPRFSIDCGYINKRTGEIINLDGCECFEDVTVTVDDGCSNPVNDVKHIHDIGTLILAGDENAAVGNYYVPVGGIAPYTYSFTGGTIDVDSGEILSISTCAANGSSAMATVSVNDSCGSSATLDIRLPDGHWVYSHETYYDPPESNYVDSCCGTSMNCGGSCYVYPDIISGNSKTEVELGARCGDWCVSGHWKPCISPVGKAAPADFNDYCYLPENNCYAISASGSGTFCRAYTFHEIFYTWECP